MGRFDPPTEIVDWKEKYEQELGYLETVNRQLLAGARADKAAMDGLREELASVRRHNWYLLAAIALLAATHVVVLAWR